jgi:hypothetical protein
VYSSRSQLPVLREKLQAVLDTINSEVEWAPAPGFWCYTCPLQHKLHHPDVGEGCTASFELAKKEDVEFDFPLHVAEEDAAASFWLDADDQRIATLVAWRNDFADEGTEEDALAA